MLPTRITKIFWYLELVPKLGTWNVLYVLYYRIILKSGILVKKYSINEPVEIGPVFTKCSIVKDFPHEWKENLLEQADKIVNGSIPYYSYHWINQSTPPNWFLNPFNGKECAESTKHWTKIPDFHSELGDIKNVWESSRFTWVGILARAYAVSGNSFYLNTLNDWITDWVIKNPLNQGPNWKCGQEASFRLICLLNAANILNQTDDPSGTLIMIIRLHLNRISSNIRYAFAQRNNHATSEAAALFIGGNWLQKVNASDRHHSRIYAKKGRDALELLVRSLTYEDGSFAQHSANYHRLFLDTLTFTQFWTRRLNLQEFTSRYLKNVEKSLDWLLSIVDESGKCPNLGSNDGTMLLGNHSCDYRDYRPSLQSASVMLRGHSVFDNGPYDEAVYWLGVKKNNYDLVPFLKETKVQKSGTIVMAGGNSWALLRFPFFKFRPSHNDVFHFDLWANGRNLLFDSGSYSYNPERGCKVPDLKSVISHNTLSFDHEEQMPRLGRFLLAKWIKPLTIGRIDPSNDAAGEWEGTYKDAAGNLHMRRVKWKNNNWEIHDKYTGKAKCVEIGFNFENCKYSIENSDNALILPWGKIIVSNNATFSVKRHMFSQYYFQSEEGYRLVISSLNNSEVTTSIHIY